MSETIFVVVRYKVKAGQEQKFRELFQPLIEASKADEGCINYDLRQSIDDSTVFVLCEAWENRELLNVHATKPHLKEFRSKVKDLMAEPPQLNLLK
ncbi:MAG: putative quinol monooxygenase [Deltaproteobacteria bacterium]|jgi:quinol monooxygenase YgiN|nr:putative quinol monooxygenase [Deltaproteobacteria bacterium]